ncbi:MAG: TonB-dependent receptor [Novosphingobium sp.]|uniref:TonB-dependent receptor n=1 Tax=Novosphingobium sp. TaxID=1874826 RepID=UPI0032B767AF
MVLRVKNDRANRLPRAYRFGAASALAMAALMPQVAWAQDAAPAEAVTDEGGEIVVSGIRYSIANSINQKKNNDSIVEAVSAEEIGKLPDVSIAESIARLPGLAAQRVGGRAQSISIRGLSPDFATTLLNGRQQASSGDNRSVEFDQYPSELLSGVVIYKTPDANIAGMGLSGTIDLHTVRPLAYGKRAIAVNVRGEVTSGGRLNGDVKNWGNRISASYIDQNEDGTLGWAFGFAHLDAPSQTQHFKQGFYGDPGAGNTRITPAAAAAQGVQYGSFPEMWGVSRTQIRNAAIGIVEWKPSDNVHTTLDLYYSRFKQRETVRGAQWYSMPQWSTDQIFTNVGVTTIGGTPVATSGTVANIRPQLRNDYNTRDDELISVGLNNDFQMTDNLSFIADLSYSRNNRDESITETYAGYGVGANGSETNGNITWDNLPMFSGDFPTYTPSLNYGDPTKVSLGDRAGWGHDGATKEPHVREKVYALDLGLQYQLDDGFFRQFDVGVNFTKREKNKRVDEFDLFLKNGRAQTLVGSQYLVDPVNLGYVGFNGNVLSVNLPAALPVYYDKRVYIDNNTFDKAWKIDEEVLTGRFRAAFELGGLRGNAGVQVVNVRQESSGSAINATATPRVVNPVNVSATYTDILPSLNLTYNIDGGHQLRFGIAKVVARPRMDELRASFIPSFPRSPCAPSTGGNPPTCVVGGVSPPNVWGGSGGNAKLEPWRAWSFDASYSWYIDKTSYFSVAGFYKSLDSYIYTQRQYFDFTGLPIPAGSFVSVGNTNGLPIGSVIGTVPTPGIVTINPIGQIDQPANGKGGSIKGLEISGALGFGKLTSALDGFGVLGSVSITESDLHPSASSNSTTVQATRIPGLSGTVWSLTGYFEKGGFQARASYRYRSAFKGEVTQLFAARGATEILAEKQVDAQIGYTFQDDSSLAGLGILLQVNNLTNSAYRTRQGTDGGGAKTADGTFLPEIIDKYGRQILFGVSYKY